MSGPFSLPRLAALSAALLTLTVPGWAQQKPGVIRNVDVPAGFEDMVPATKPRAPAPSDAGPAKTPNPDFSEGDKGAAAGPIKETAPPAGFESLAKARPVLVDVFFDSRRLGQAMAVYDNGKIAFKEPGKIVALLPGVRDKRAVEQALGTPIPANRDRLCRTGDANTDTQCGALSPKVAGVIFDEGNLKLHVFVNPNLLDSRAIGLNKYLPGPDTELSFVSQISSSLSGRSDEKTQFSVNTLNVLAFRDARFKADISLDQGGSWQPSILAFELDRPGWRAEAGYFRGLGSSLVPDLNYYGVGVGTSTDTRLDLEHAYGSQLAVLVRRPATVEILRDGRILSSRIYQPGNRVLDTSNLPAGAYNVTVRVRELSGETREETRFFVKSELIPPADQPFFFLSAGTLAERSPSPTAARRNFGLPPPTSFPIAKATARVRIADGLALGFEAAGTRDEGIFEGSVFYLHPLARLNASAFVGTARDYGLSAGIGGNYKKFGYSANVRYVRAARSYAETGIDAKSFRFINGSSLQMTGSFAYQFEKARLSFTGQYRRSSIPGQTETYSFGPTAEVELWRNPTHTVNLSGEFFKTERGYSAYARLAWRWQAPKAVVVTAETGARYTRAKPTNNELREFARIEASYQPPAIWDHEFLFQPSIQRDGPTLVGLDVGARGWTGRTRASIRQIYDGAQKPAQRWATAYNVNYATGIAIDKGGVALGGRDAGTSGVIAQIRGKGDTGKYEVLVDGSPKGVIEPGRPLPIFLAPYRTYQISMRAVSANQRLASIVATTKTVTLYPGNVLSVIWKVEPVTVVFGRLVDGQGQPLSNAAIEGVVGHAETDGQGYFQAEVNGAKPLTVKANGRPACSVQLPKPAAGAEIVKVGTLPCR